METRTFLWGIIILTLPVFIYYTPANTSVLTTTKVKLKQPLIKVQLEGIKTFHSPVRIRYPPVAP